VLGFCGSLLEQPSSNVESVGMEKWAGITTHVIIQT
jgi:hypothetical protein